MAVLELWLLLRLVIVILLVGLGMDGCVYIRLIRRYFPEKIHENKLPTRP
jgi:hypothetical protein